MSMDNLNLRQNGRIIRTHSDTVSHVSLQKEHLEISGVTIKAWKLKKDEQGNLFAVYIIRVVMRSGKETFIFCIAFAF